MGHIKQWYLCKFKNACVEKYNEQEYIQIKDCTKHIGMSVGDEDEGNGGRRREGAGGGTIRSKASRTSEHLESSASRMTLCYGNPSLRSPSLFLVLNLGIFLIKIKC